MLGGRVAGLQTHGKGARHHVRLEPAIHVIHEAKLVSNPIDQARGKSAAAENIIHDRHAIKVGIFPFDPHMAQDNVGLREVFIDDL